MNILKRQHDITRWLQDVAKEDRLLSKQLDNLIRILRIYVYEDEALTIMENQAKLIIANENRRRENLKLKRAQSKQYTKRG